MKKERILAGALCLALLAGCTAAKTSEQKDDHQDDLAWQAAGIQRDYAIVTVDGQPITAEAYLFWVCNTVLMLEQRFGTMTDDMWESYGDAIKAAALRQAQQYRVVRTKAEEYGAVLSDEQRAEMDELMTQAEAWAGGEEAFAQYLESMCISREGYDYLEESAYLMDSLVTVMQDKGEITVTQADLEQYALDYVEENGIYGAKHILLLTQRQTEDGTVETFSDQEKAQALERLRGYLAEIRAAQDTEAKFDELMDLYSEDGRDESGALYHPEGYTTAFSGEMVTEFEQAALALEVGQVSDVVTTSYGYHILLRVPVDMEKVKDEYATEEALVGEKFNQIAQGWMDNAQVETTAAYDDLAPKAFWDKLEEVVEAREIARALENHTAGETAETED